VGQCISKAFDTSRKVNCSKYVYDTSEFKETLTTELDLVCDKVDQRHALGSIMMLGLMTGSLLGGPLSNTSNLLHIVNRYITSKSTFQVTKLEEKQLF
jgi:hypothetical protein